MHANITTDDEVQLLLGRDPRLRSVLTRDSYERDLAAFRTWCGDRVLTRLLVEQYAAELQTSGRSPASINRSLSAVRWWARRMGETAVDNMGISREEREQIVAQAMRVQGIANVKPGTRKRKGRHLNIGEVLALLRACEMDSSVAGIRDGSLIALAWFTGIRQSELTGLDVGDVRIEGEVGYLTVRHGKGDKERPLTFYNGALDAVADWLTIRGAAPGYLFCSIRRGGHLELDVRLSHEGMRGILCERIRQARTKPLTWHDLRRTFIGNLLDQGTDLSTAQRLAGHASPTTTASYDRRDDQVQRKAMQSLFLPYQRRTLPIEK